MCYRCSVDFNTLSKCTRTQLACLVVTTSCRVLDSENRFVLNALHVLNALICSLYYAFISVELKSLLILKTFKVRN